MSELDPKVVKEMIKALNIATYKDGEGAEVKFLETPIKITIGATVEALAIAFAAAVNGLSDDITGQLPDAVIDFYNETDFPTEPTPEKKEDTVKKPAAAAPAKKPAAAAPAAAPAAPAKKPAAAAAPAKKPAVKTNGKKEKAELSAFGHKMNTQSAKLDAMLAPGKGVSLADLVKGSGRSELGVKSHIKHLIDDRKLTINEKDGIYRYVKNASK